MPLKSLNVEPLTEVEPMDAPAQGAGQDGDTGPEVTDKFTNLENRKGTEVKKMEINDKLLYGGKENGNQRQIT